VASTPVAGSISPPRKRPSIARCTTRTPVARSKKRDYRGLWIARINAGLATHGISYSRFISALKKLGIELDRRVLASMATEQRKAFVSLVDLAKGEEQKRQEAVKAQQKKAA
jgi:ribosomal protein L20